MQFCNDCGTSSDPVSDATVILWDYETITITVESIEELYNALYQPIVFEYMRSLRPFSDRDVDYWFIHVKDIEVLSYDSEGKEIDNFLSSAEVHVGAVPFPYDDGAFVVDEIATHFGLIEPGQPRYHHNLVFTKESLGKLQWEERAGTIMMFSTVKGIGVSSGAYCSYVILSADEYCAALRMCTAVIYASPLAVPVETPKGVLEHLTVTTKYEIPKYVFGMGYETEYEVKVEPLFMDYGMQTCQTEYMDLLDADDICVYIDHSYYIMQILKEGTHIFMANNMNLDTLKGLEYSGTALLECHMELDTAAEPPLDESFREFSIFSDPWQDYPPTTKEVCYLILLAEKEK